MVRISLWSFASAHYRYFVAFRVVMGVLVFALVAIIILDETARCLLSGTSIGAIGCGSYDFTETLSA